MSGGRVMVAEVLNRLVVNPTEERNVGAAKEVFDGMVEKRCVWSDKVLRTGYAVDHVIPFRLWHCNDLWNLLPCDAQVNGRKSDKEPGARTAVSEEGRDCLLLGERATAIGAALYHELVSFTAKKAKPGIGRIQVFSVWWRRWR